MNDMLKRLTSAFGVSGAEEDVRDIILETLAQRGINDLRVDGMGNVIAYKKGLKENGGTGTVMLCAHIDEVGLIVTEITKKGFLRFKTIGGIDARVLPAKRVTVGKNRISGVIGSKPSHLKKKNDETLPEIEKMFIDVGGNKERVEEAIKIGDYVCFVSEYTPFGENLVKAKALDDRVGCAILLELAKYQFDCNIYFVFTVQEEVGCRGAKAVMHNILGAAEDAKGTALPNPDFAIVVEGTTCDDALEEDIKSGGFSTKLGEGAAVSIFDKGSYSDKELSKKLYDTAVQNGIKVQYKQTIFGGNDASAIHISGSGVRTAAISVPCRYIHSPSSVASLEDIEGCKEILRKLLETLSSPRL